MQEEPPGDGSLPQSVVDKLEAQACRNWDIFYKRNADRFFKDRHYLDREFDQLRPPPPGAPAEARTFAEVGCGAGNTVLPLLRLHPRATVYACDFSPRAVELTQQRALAAGVADRLRAFACDVTQQPLVPKVPPRSCDAITLIFALSAMAPAAMPAAVAHCAAALAPGGAVLVRDYAAGDLAETRLAARSQRLSDGFYARSDGTRAYYFSEAALTELFAAQGLACASCTVHERDITNRAQGITMARRWIQATFVHAGEPLPAPLPPLPLPCDDDADDDMSGEADGVASTGGDLGCLFSGVASASPADAAAGEPTLVRSAGRQLRLRLLGREHQHTERATGAMLWEGARALAEHLAATPSLVAGKAVLELGAGAAGLPSLAASAAGARAVVATDGHPGVLGMLSANLSANDAAHIATLRLRWAHAGDAALARAAAGGSGSFDLVLGADVVYDAAALRSLFTSASGLLRRDGGGGALLLCHVADRGGVSEAALERAALAAGLHLAPESLAAAAEAALEGAPRCRLLRGTLLCNARHV